MNNGNIIGRLTRDIEISYSKQGKVFGKSAIAVTDRFDKNKTHFFNFVCFGKTAEIMSQYLNKGSQVGLTYELSQDRWQTNEGQVRSKISLIVKSFSFCGSKNDNGSNYQGSNNSTPEPIDFEEPKGSSVDFDEMPPMGNDEVPF
jgi:single-strand DNA-binding protein